VLHGDLVVYGRGDPTFSAHCYGADTLAADRCDSLWTGIDALADGLVARGLRRVEGAIVGDGSAFEPHMVHDAWERYDLNWWYAAPVSGLGFDDDCVDIGWKPAPGPDAPAVLSFSPDLGAFTFENRSRTTAPGTPTTLDFFREPGTMSLWAEGEVPSDDAGGTESFAMPDPNLYFAQALRARLAARGVAISGPALSTVDSLRTRDARRGEPLASRASRPLSDIVFPILNSSQNWFAEMLLKLLGRERGGSGSWETGLGVERRFLVDAVGIDSTSFASVDGSGLATNNLVSARALTQIVRYARGHEGREAFVRAMPRSGQPGSLRRRFVGTALAGRVVAKTGSVERVNSLAGWIEPPRGGRLDFAIIVNGDAGPSKSTVARIDSVVVEMAR
jgi:D-alanyl-D-alanine carboxypeptidase/D-alanyl-D-alanine-endopeptidase (penicillin-binding protein 4)